MAAQSNAVDATTSKPPASFFTMRKLILTFLFLAFSSSAFAQDDEEIKFPDHVMKQVVKHVLTWYFKPSGRQRTVYLADRMLKRKWLPKIRNVNFVVLDDKGVTKRLNPNGVYDTRRGVHHFRSIDRENGLFHVSFGYGNPGCEAEGDIWNVRIVRTRVRIWIAYGGWGSDCHAVAAQTNLLRGHIDRIRHARSLSRF